MQMLIDFDARTITLNGVAMSLQLLETLTNPDQAKYYHFVRRGDVVIVEPFLLPEPDPNALEN